jgi:hypothetical protein
LPPAIVHGKNGRPLYSWRVLILPYLDQQRLYDEFKLDEPWDSTHNRTLLPSMPKIFAPPGANAQTIPPYHTVCHVFVGDNTVFGNPRFSAPKDFAEWQSTTFLIVEAGTPVPWTKPQEIAYSIGKPLPELSGVFPNGFRASFMDGHVEFITNDVPELVLRACICGQKHNAP